jgi:hypothetical protein
MNPRIQIIAIAGSVVVMLVVAQLIRRRKLSEEYALFWFFASVVLIGMSLWRDSLHVAARLTGVAYPPSLLLLGMIVVGFFLAMHYSISLSKLAERNKRLTQEVALLKLRLERLPEMDAGQQERSNPSE